MASLGATGKGHGTDKGVMLGLMGEAPDTVDPETIECLAGHAARPAASWRCWARTSVPFVEREHIVFYRREAMAEHPNGMKFHAFDADGTPLREARYLSVGGGFVVTGRRAEHPDPGGRAAVAAPVPQRRGRCWRWRTRAASPSPGSCVENELTWRPEQEVTDGPASYLEVMQQCVTRGCRTDGELPGAVQGEAARARVVPGS